MNNCPNCNHELVNIIYGMPSPKLVNMAKSEGIALGGCSVHTNRPTHYCYGCHQTFGEDDSVIFELEKLFSNQS